MTLRVPHQPCKKCFEAASAAFPSLTFEDRFDVLMSATCYPFGCVEDVGPQLDELVAAGCKTVLECCAFADEKTAAQMKRFHEQENAEA